MSRAVLADRCGMDVIGPNNLRQKALVWLLQQAESSSPLPVETLRSRAADTLTPGVFLGSMDLDDALIRLHVTGYLTLSGSLVSITERGLAKLREVAMG